MRISELEQPFLDTPLDVSQRAGLSLEEIRELLDAGTDPISDKLQRLAARKLPEVERLIARTSV